MDQANTKDNALDVLCLKKVWGAVLTVLRSICLGKLKKCFKKLKSRNFSPQTVLSIGLGNNHLQSSKKKYFPKIIAYNSGNTKAIQFP